MNYYRNSVGLSNANFISPDADAGTAERSYVGSTSIAYEGSKIFSHLFAPAIRRDWVISPRLRGYHARPFNHASFRALSKSDYRTMPRKFDSTATAT